MFKNIKIQNSSRLRLPQDATRAVTVLPWLQWFWWRKEPTPALSPSGFDLLGLSQPC